MTRWPFIKVTPSTPDQRERLARWLDEWALDRRLRESDGGVDDFPEPVSFQEGKAGEEVRPGDIRLLYPGQEIHDGPAYVAVTEAAGDLYLIIPFGRFEEPATPEEWRTERDAFPLRVLCLWNARALSADALTRSWRVDCLTAREKEDVRILNEWMESERALPSGLAHAVGPPLVHPLDPRHDYLEEETGRLDRALGKDWWAERDGYPALNEPDESALLLAADKRETYGGEAARYRVLQTALRLQVFRPEGDHCRVRISDRAGETVTDLDGGMLYGTGGTVSDVIRKGLTRVPVSFLESTFWVVDPRGRRYRVKRA